MLVTSSLKTRLLRALGLRIAISSRPMERTKVLSSVMLQFLSRLGLKDSQTNQANQSGSCRAISRSRVLTGTAPRENARMAEDNSQAPCHSFPSCAQQL